MHPYGMLCSFNIETSMRDGVTLRGDLYRLCAQGKYPLLLWRTIFRKNTLARSFGQYDPAFFVRNGYAVFIQDARGLGESDGEFDRFTADGKDGYDTVEWLATQDFCDGNVGMIGNYFAGYLQLMAAAEQPPHLKAICPMQTSVSINRDCDNRGFLFYSHIGWCISRQISRLRDGRYDEKTTQRYLPFLLEYIRNYSEPLLHRPLCDMPAIKDTPFPLLKDYFKCLVEDYDNLDMIHREGRGMDLSGMKIPALYCTGWYDSSRNSVIDHCRAQRENGTGSEVLIAPWRGGDVPARADSALETGEIVVDIQGEMLSWFDHWLKGVQRSAPKPYRYYDVADAAFWQGDDWLEAENGCRTLYLHDGNILSHHAPGENETADSYHHDPDHPLPFVPIGAAGIRLDARPEALLYKSEPLDMASRIRGLVRARLFVSADVLDADVILRLIDLKPDGSTFVVCDGATRCRYRNGWTSEPLEKEKVYEIEVLMGHMLYTMQPGHRLLLEITGSAFPKYDVNNSTAKRPAFDTDAVKACVSVHHTGLHASALLLPIGDE